MRNRSVTIFGRTLLLALLLSAASARPLDPPFSGTIFIDPDIITASDPSDFTEATYRGQGMRTMFDRRVNNWVQQNAFLVDAAFADGSIVEVQVNPEFGSQTEAMDQATRWATEVGRLPRALRTDLQTMWIHKGTNPFGGGNQNILIHTGQAQLYINDGILEETLVHEASHTSLDAYWAAHPDWLAAQQADPDFISTYARDNPNREDIAETFLTWLAVRHRPDRISADLKQTIETAIPNRLSFFDGLNLDLQPLSTATGVDLPQPFPGTPALGVPYPNPANAQVTVPMHLAAAGLVRVEVVDATGRIQRVLADEAQASGTTLLTWDGRNAAGKRLSSGTYFIRLQAGPLTSTRPLTWLSP